MSELPSAPSAAHPPAIRSGPPGPRVPGPEPAAHARRTFTQRIDAPPDQVFPLLCPVREAEWLDDWSYDLLRSSSGFAEEGCVFRTTYAGEPETIWIVTRHDAAAGRVEFARVTAGLVATHLRIRVEPLEGGRSAVHVTYELTPTSAEGERVVAARYSEEAFRRSMEWWERSMNHYLATGTILREGTS